MNTTFNMLINGEMVAGSDSFEIINPATKTFVANAPEASEEQLNQAVAAAKAAFPAWAALSYAQRSEKIVQIAAAIENASEELMEILTKEQGKPLGGFKGDGAGFEMGGTLAWIRATAEYKLETKVIQDDDVARIELHRKPLGVVGSISPWNFPLMVTTWHIIPALLAGNTVVVKPSEMTPLTVLRFAELVKDILPKGVINVVSGHGSVGAGISAHKDISKVIFTGSTPTGKAIMSSAADNLKKLTLELGGNDAAIVLDDANVSAIAEKIFTAAFMNNGQTCIALKRLYVHENVYDDVCKALTDIATKVKTGNGLEKDTDFGPLQNQKQLDIIVSLAQDAKENGATILCGGEIVDTSGLFFPITLVSDIKDGTRLVDEEQFGPILPIIKFSDVDEAIALANANENGLGGSVWSTDIEKAKKIASQLECGSAWINSHAMIQPHVPFGGIKQSGIGTEFTEEGLQEFTNIQTVQVFKG